MKQKEVSNYFSRARLLPGVGYATSVDLPTSHRYKMG